MSLAIMVPTKGRPENAVRLAGAVGVTAGREMNSLYFMADPDEPRYQEYQGRLDEAAPWAYLVRQAARPQRIGPMLNQAASALAERFTHVGFMGDDHLPRTLRWDEILVSSLGGRPGVAYGNDLWQGENLPTMAILSSDLIRGLGFFAPPGLEHLYLDDFWKLLGLGVGNLAYRADVIIEHIHPMAGKAQFDAVYQAANADGQKTRDGEEFARYRNLQWDADLQRLKEYLSG